MGRADAHVGGRRVGAGDPEKEHDERDYHASSLRLVIVDDTPLHAARDRHDLPGHVPGKRR